MDIAIETGTHYIHKMLAKSAAFHILTPYFIFLNKLLEEAYLASRYLFKEYEIEEAKELVEFAEKVINFVKNIQRSDQA